MTSTSGGRVAISMTPTSGWTVQASGQSGTRRPARADRSTPAEPGSSPDGGETPVDATELTAALPSRLEDGPEEALESPVERVLVDPPGELEPDLPELPSRSDPAWPHADAPTVSADHRAPLLTDPVLPEPPPLPEPPSTHPEAPPCPERSPLVPDAASPLADPALLPPDGAPPSRPVVAVLALAPRCGTSTVARWLAAALAGRDPDGAAILATSAPRGPGALRTPAAARAARALVARAIEPVRASGRLCLVDASQSPLSIAATYLAPLVIDVGHGEPADAALSVADHVLLVAAPRVEPALAEVVSQRLASDGPPPTVILNRAVEADNWDGRADVVLPESRLAARRAYAGREARGPIGGIVAALAEELEGSLWE
jgi:hypothetical protein